ncbi:MAG: bifunctional phosphopantothenoylcysteine decarboxylase/phosphopantothenate--cysteine ligase CoaBC, partial [Ferruginibacter sp.]
AAYKIPILVRLLVKEGAEVRIVATTAAHQFVTPLVLSTVSAHPVYTDLTVNDAWTNHVALGRWADLMIVAPLSCNTLAKMANGNCDNLLMAVYLSATCPIVVAPAMDEDMWLHPTTKKNIDTISKHGNSIIAVEKGSLASGLIGEGRMAEPETILQWVNDFLIPNKKLSGKNVLISGGPTIEPIDPVRFISNHSTGKMALELAKEFAKQGANVTFVVGPVHIELPNQGMQIYRVTTAEEMYNTCTQYFPQMDIAVMCAAVADYTPLNKAQQKIKKSDAALVIELGATKDILKAIGNLKQSHQTVVGFALETNQEEFNALKKLKEKNADYIVLNSLNDVGAGFGHDTNKVTIFSKTGNRVDLNTASKATIAAQIIQTII